MTESELNYLRPFVRYAHITRMSDTTSFRNVCAYDFRLLYLKSGNGSIIAGGNEYPFVPGALILLRPGLEYSIINDKCRELEIVGFNFDLDFLNSEIKKPIPPSRLGNFKEEEIIIPRGFSSDSPFYEVIYLPSARDFEPTLVGMVGYYKNKLRYYEHKISGVLLSVLADLVGRNRSGKELHGGNEKVEKILTVISERYGEPLSNETIAEELGYHKNHINRLMVLYTGVSLHRYLQNYRLERAIELLETTACPVSEIALRVGFDDFSHFSKYFKKHIGYSPTELRRTGGK